MFRELLKFNFSASSFEANLPPETLAKRLAEETRQEHISEVAAAAFEKYDVDGNGTIDKEELFAVLRDLGHVLPTRGNETEVRHYLDMSFSLADTNGDGVVDREEVGTADEPVLPGTART